MSTYISDAKRVEAHYGDLDERFDEDGLSAVLDELRYSKDDERHDRPIPLGLDNKGNVYNCLGGYRTSVRLYREFREGRRSGYRFFGEPVGRLPARSSAPVR